MNEYLTKTDNGDLIASTKALCDLFQVDKATISRWHKKGCPKLDIGQWSLKDVIGWYMARLEVDPNNPEARELRDRKILAETLYREERAKIQKIGRETLEEQYISREDVINKWNARVVEVKAGMTTWVNRLPSMLSNRKANDVEKILTDEVYEFLNQYHKNGTYIPKEER